jgi:hypothetical protein
MSCRHREHERGADTRSLDRLSKQAGAKQFHSRFPVQIDVLMRDRSRRIEDLVFRYCVRFKRQNRQLPATALTGSSPLDRIPVNIQSMHAGERHSRYRGTGKSLGFRRVSNLSI